MSIDFDQYKIKNMNNDNYNFDQYKINDPEKLKGLKNNKVNTFLGQMPTNLPEFKFGSPQNQDLIKEMINSFGTGTGGLGIARNATKLSAKNILKDIVETGKFMGKKYQDLYGNLFKEAEKRGTGNFDLSKIDINKIKSYAPESHHESTLKFLENPTLENAQTAQSDLGKYLRKNKDRSSIPTPEQESLTAAKEARDYLQENMFKDASGKIHEDLIDQYNKVKHGYKIEKIPYSNKVIKDYIEGDLTAKQAIDKLSSNKFYAKRGKFHPNMDRRDVVNSFISKTPYVAGGAVGGGLLAKLFGLGG